MIVIFETYGDAKFKAIKGNCKGPAARYRTFTEHVRGCPFLQLLLTLRFLATGAFYGVNGDTVNVSASTVCRTIDRVLTAINSLRLRVINFPDDDELPFIKNDFAVLSSFVAYFQLRLDKVHNVLEAQTLIYHSCRGMANYAGEVNKCLQMIDGTETPSKFCLFRPYLKGFFIVPSMCWNLCNFDPGTLLYYRISATMAHIQRKNTIKITFPAEAVKPTALELHNWIDAELNITPDQVEMIQLNTLERSIYLKLTSVTQYERLMNTYEGEVNFKYENQSIIKVSFQRADINAITVRIFNVPPEVENNLVNQSLSQYGTVKTIRAELWSTQYKFPVNNGVRAVRIEMQKHIPSKLIIGGYTAVIHYPGQPQLCYICGESSHLRSECPRRKFSFPVTVAGRKPLLSEVVGGMSTNVRNITDQPTNLIEDPVQQVNVKEQMTNRQVEMQTENSTTGLNNGDSHDTSPVRPEDEHITPSVPMQGTSSMNTTTEYYAELALQTHTEINDKNKGQQKDGEEQMMEDDAEATDSDIEMEKNMSENNISIPQRQLQQKIMEQPRDDSDGKKELPRTGILE
ncbi:hypothetical protein ANN_26843 [Periplaneta americana]|uniref:CCHC-type domain-containing protein n=1 Tax=Periplaneta americana TaxID=6978 RepID=A0ABQ8RZ87_PERAM|nr:hypothetical protein ANN_26843 [Periplaneta americana]